MVLAVSISLPLFITIVSFAAIAGGLISAIIFWLRFRPCADMEQQLAEQRQIVRFLQQEIIKGENRSRENKNTIDELKAENVNLRHSMEMLSAKVEIDKSTAGYHLLAVVGTDSATKDDLLSLRQSGIDINLSHPPTLDTFEKRLSFLRANGRLPKGLHFGLHAGSAGIEFEDKLATIEWLSENISDVETVLISGCRGADIGFALGGFKQRVVTVQHQIESEHAALLTRVFWEQIASGKNAVSAYAETRRRLPPGVAELLEIH